MKRAFSIVLVISAGASIARASEVLYLDTRDPSAVQTVQALSVDTTYAITVTGTVSAWVVDEWADYCGQYEEYPLFPSPGVQNGPVGLDADVYFAWAWLSTCPPVLPCHAAYDNFRMQLDTQTWSHVEPEGGPYSAPTADHVYHYLVTGQGFPAAFYWYDDVYWDNYGMLQIVVAPASPTSIAEPAPAPGLLLSAFPNPVVTNATISYALPIDGEVELRIVDAAGRVIDTLVDGFRRRGVHRTRWIAQRAGQSATAAGVYWVVLSTEEGARAQRLVVVR
jgi:hypothetical protein